METVETFFKENRINQRRHHDDDYLDEILIKTPAIELHAHMVPRLKTSGMSGDEWRVSAVMDVHVTADSRQSDVFSSMERLLAYAPYFLYTKYSYYLNSPNATLTGYRKGVRVFEGTFASFGDAALGMGWHYTQACERDMYNYHHLTDAEEQARCCQVGCKELPTVVFGLKKLHIGNSGDMKEPGPHSGRHVWYCSKHSERGDCDLEDCDSNLELLAGSRS